MLSTWPHNLERCRLAYLLQPPTGLTWARPVAPATRSKRSPRPPSRSMDAENQLVLTFRSLVSRSPHSSLQLDKMGNECTQSAGEAVECTCTSESVRAQSVDLGDGSYAVSWHSERPGRFVGAVKVYGQHVVHSPFTLEFVSTSFVLEHTEITGLGLTDRLGEAIVVDERATVRVRLRDVYRNDIAPTASLQQLLKIGVALPTANVLRGKDSDR